MSDNEREKYFLNVSVGIKGDPHVSKAIIDSDACIGCGECESHCLDNAIVEDGSVYKIIEKKCIGCGECVDKCPVDAISKFHKCKPYNEVLPPLAKLGVDSFEFHAVSEDEEAVQEQWLQVCECFDGVLSICVDRSVLGDKQLIARLKKMIGLRPDYSVIIQADGAPMSGGDDSPSTTLQALGCAKVVQDAGLPVYLLLSGGTNSVTTELAKTFDIEAHGVSIGSFARKIVREYIDRDDFFGNQEIFNNALQKAKWLVDKSLKYMG